MTYAYISMMDHSGSHPRVKYLLDGHQSREYGGKSSDHVLVLPYEEAVTKSKELTKTSKLDHSPVVLSTEEKEHYLQHKVDRQLSLF